LIYVQPLYVEAAANPVPRLADVIMVYNKQAYHGANLNAALCQLPFGQAFCSLPGGSAPAPGTTTGTGTTGGTGGTTTPSTTPSTTTPATTSPTTAPPGGQTVQQLLTSAQAHFQNAQNALKAGNLATYQTEVNSAQADVAKAQQQASSGTPPASTPPTSAGP
jgi:uncharacterized membrane protein (UPF0182 family)